MLRSEVSDVGEGDGGGGSGNDDAAVLPVSSGHVTGTKRKPLSAGWIVYVEI